MAANEEIEINSIKMNENEWVSENDRQVIKREKGNKLKRIKKRYNALDMLSEIKVDIVLEFALFYSLMYGQCLSLKKFCFTSHDEQSFFFYFYSVFPKDILFVTPLHKTEDLLTQLPALLCLLYGNIW